MPRKKKLPKHVTIQHGKWYVQKRFPGLKYPVWRVCNDQTQAGVDAILEEIKQDLKKPAAVEVTMDQVFDEWLSSIRDQVSERTHEDYSENLKRYFRKPLGAMPADQVTEEDVRTILDGLRDRELSTRTRQYAHRVVSMALKRGVARKTVLVNPMTLLKAPRVRRGEMVIFDQDESRKFFEQCDKFEEGVIFQFALESGARPEEYLALQRPDLNTRNHSVTVNRAVVFSRNGDRWHFEPPKTEKSRRTIKLSVQLFTKLKKHFDKIDGEIADLEAQDNAPTFRKGKPVTTREVRIEREARRRLEAIQNHREHNLVFPNSEFTPFNVGNLGRRDFLQIKTAIKARKGITIKSLRHTCASLLLLKGVHIKIVSERLGHASIAITLETYSHILPTMQDQASETLAEMLY